MYICFQVCQETFTDMEGLANHMIVSGHHKKQVLRSHNCSDLALRHKHRKRYLSDESSGSTVASLLEYKRKYQSGSGGSNGYLPHVGASSTSGAPGSAEALVTCESCGKKIEVAWFLDHVRLCLQQKAEVIDALKMKLFGEEGGSSKVVESPSSSSVKGESPEMLEQPLPSTKDSALFKRLNTHDSGSPRKQSDDSTLNADTENKQQTDSEDTGDKIEKDEEGRSDKLLQNDTDIPESHQNDCEKVTDKIQTNSEEIEDQMQTDGLELEGEDQKHGEENENQVHSDNIEADLAKDKDIDVPPEESSDKNEDFADSQASVSDTPRVKCTDSSNDPTPSPRPVPKDSDESQLAPKGNSDCPSSDPEQEKDESPMLCEQNSVQPNADPLAEETNVPAVTPRSISPRIPSPMTDEDNTSERSPSPHSEQSQSDDSKPPSPAVTPPPSCHSKVAPSQAFDSIQSPLKREHEPEDEEEEFPVQKKLRTEESSPKRGPEPNNSEAIKKKIKVEVQDNDSDRQETHQPTPHTSAHTSQEGRTEGSGKTPSKQQDPSLDIIDPNVGQEVAKDTGSSALKAMESFIQRSFSSKFDSRRSALAPGFGPLGAASHLPPLMSMNRMVPASSGSPSSSAAASTTSSVGSLSQFSKFFPSMHLSSSRYLDVARESPLPNFERSALSSLSAKSAELLEKTRSAGRDTSNNKAVTSNGLAAKTARAVASRPKATTPSSVHVEKQRESPGDTDAKTREEEDTEGKERNEEDGDVDLASKYLNLDAEDQRQQQDKAAAEEGEGEASSSKPSSSKGSGKKSALDSLSSFVYGQPMTSEHPLDSLQKLLTKTSMPKVMSAAAGAFPHFNPHHYPYLTEQMMERMCFTPPDLPSSSSAAAAMPLNLSMKPAGGGVSSSEEDEQGEGAHDCISPSLPQDAEDGIHSSPGTTGPDGELIEYKCAACSRRFASKGSYRYHLSRCHLSSVKKYGIKEAFNMSPYVYLPLDHTAKFTKYYQMAQELANKGK